MHDFIFKIFSSKTSLSTITTWKLNSQETCKWIFEQKEIFNTKRNKLLYFDLRVKAFWKTFWEIAKVNTWRRTFPDACYWHICFKVVDYVIDIVDTHDYLTRQIEKIIQIFITARQNKKDRLNLISSLVFCLQSSSLLLLISIQKNVVFFIVFSDQDSTGRSFSGCTAIISMQIQNFISLVLPYILVGSVA